MKVRDLPHGRLLSMGPDATLAEVAKRMRLEDCDSVAVMADKKLLGIITEGPSCRLPYTLYGTLLSTVT